MSRVERVETLLRQIEDETRVAFDEHTQLYHRTQSLEAENAKLLESVRNLLTCVKHEECEKSCPYYSPAYSSYGYERGGSTVVEDEYLGCCTVGLENCNSMLFDTDEYLRELGIKVGE